jgi:hypothetical protein
MIDKNTQSTSVVVSFSNLNPSPFALTPPNIFIEGFVNENENFVHFPCVSVKKIYTIGICVYTFTLPISVLTMVLM